VTPGRRARYEETPAATGGRMTARHGPAFSGDKAHDARAITILSMREQPALNSEQAHDDALVHHRVLGQAGELVPGERLSASR